MNIPSTSASSILPNYRADVGAIWVGYLPPQITLKELIGHFEHCGAIYQAKILRTSKSVQPFGFIWFEKPSCAKRSLDMDRSCIHGVPIKVRYKRFQEEIMSFPPPPPPRSNVNISKTISSLQPVHVANPDALAVAKEPTTSETT